MKKILTMAALLVMISFMAKSQTSFINLSNKNVVQIPGTSKYNKNNFQFYNNNLDSNTTDKKKYYMDKSKSQKTTAWTLLGVGTGLIGAGFLIGDRRESSFDQAAIGVVLGGIGLASTITSLPFFIASSKNKTKARLTIGSKASSPIIPTKAGKTVHGISLQIPLG